MFQAVQVLLELPLSLVTNSPAHIPNWDMVADVVNASSRTYRSPKQCKNRYENVIVLREEGKILYDANPRKQKKTKGLYKVYISLLSIILFVGCICLGILFILRHSPL